MMVETSTLTGPALDWAVAKCEELRGVKFGKGFYGEKLLLDENEFGHRLSYSTDWAQGGPIIERENISVGYQGHLGVPLDSLWYATNRGDACGFGQTSLIAAMRCYVASKLGNQINVPEELL